MGKRKVPKTYNRQHMEALAGYIEEIRKPLEGGKIPGIHVILDKLEEVIRNIPEKERERLEKFWGLLPNTINHGSNIWDYIKKKREAQGVIDSLPEEEWKKLKDLWKTAMNPNKNTSAFLVTDYSDMKEEVEKLPEEKRKKMEEFWNTAMNLRKKKSELRTIAYQEMKEKSDEVVRKLVSVEYLEKYDENVYHILQDVARKANRGNWQISDINTVKYLMILGIIIDNGPQMPFDAIEEIDYNPEDDAEATFDDYAMLCDIWETFKLAPDNIINLPLLIETIEMFDWRDVIAIKRFANIPINHTDSMDFEEEIVPRSLMEIRKFKEKIFLYGSWDTTIKLILRDEKTINGFENFINQLDEIRKDWKKLINFKTDRKRTIMTSQGERILDIYEIAGLEFTDSYEVMFLCVARNII